MMEVMDGVRRQCLRIAEPMVPVAPVMRTFTTSDQREYLRFQGGLFRTDITTECQMMFV